MFFLIFCTLLLFAALTATIKASDKFSVSELDLRMDRWMKQKSKGSVLISVIHFLSFCSLFIFHLLFSPVHLIQERMQSFNICPCETATVRFCQTTQTSRMQSPLATAEPAHSALRWPVEGAATVLPVVMAMEGWDGEGGAWMGVRREGNSGTTT